MPLYGVAIASFLFKNSSACTDVMVSWEQNYVLGLVRGIKVKDYF